MIEEVKLAVKPYYSRHVINKDEYKEIMRKTVPKVRGDGQVIRNDTCGVGVVCVCLIFFCLTDLSQ